MQCPVCGAKVPEGMEDCPDCGYPVKRYYDAAKRNSLEASGEDGSQRLDDQSPAKNHRSSGFRKKYDSQQSNDTQQSYDSLRSYDSQQTYDSRQENNSQQSNDSQRSYDSQKFNDSQQSYDSQQLYDSRQMDGYQQAGYQQQNGYSQQPGDQQGAYQPYPENSGNNPDGRVYNSTLSIVAFVFSFLMPIVAIILGIVDLAKKDRAKKHSLSIAAIIISAIFMILSLAVAIPLVIRIRNYANSASGTDDYYNGYNPSVTTSPFETFSQYDTYSFPAAGAESGESDAALPSEEAGDYKVAYQNVTVKADTIGIVTADAIVQIENTGSDNLYLSSTSFDFEGEDGKIVGSDSLVTASPEILAPGEKGCLFIPYGTELANGTNPSQTFTLVPNLEIRKAKNSIVRYDVSETSMSQDTYGTFNIVGRITNNTADKGNSVLATAVFYDKDDKPIAGTETYLSGLDAGQTLGFEMKYIALPDGITSDDIGRFEVYAILPQYQYD